MNLASINGISSPEEEVQLGRFARMLDTTDEEYNNVLESAAAFPVNPHNSVVRRLGRLHDLFTIIFLTTR